MGRAAASDRHPEPVEERPLAAFFSLPRGEGVRGWLADSLWLSGRSEQRPYQISEVETSVILKLIGTVCDLNEKRSHIRV